MTHAPVRHCARFLALLVLSACGEAPRAPAEAPDKPLAAARTAAALRPLDEGSIPAGPLGASIRRGLALVEHTPDSLPGYATSALRCTSCHLDRGLRADAAPLAGAYLKYPGHVQRAGAVVSIEDRVNYCFTRSLAGQALPAKSREMVDIVSYLSFVSRNTGDGTVAGAGMPTMPALTPDTARGRELYAASCARCHGAEGQGVAPVPAVWGARSYSVGASMARNERAASFIRHNMPYDQPRTLSDQQAWDVAAYVNSHARPDMPGKEQDWPDGGAPADVPYATPGRVPARVSPVLPRANPPGTRVPVPVSAPARLSGPSTPARAQR